MVFFRLLRAVNIGFCACLILSQSLWAGQKDYIAEQFSNGDFPLVSIKSNATIYVDQGDYKGVLRAVNNLQKDIEKVTGQRLDITNDITSARPFIIVGTVGRSAIIERLIKDNKLKLDTVAGQWEAFRIQLIDNPFGKGGQALVIAGSDKRGTTFGIYDLVEKVGVSPWYWWADVPVKTRRELFVKAGTLYQDQPKVKYRGIFLNDEAPALTNWVHKKYGNYNHEFYEHVFDLLLRLKANFLWPAMWNNAFSDDDPLNMVLADEYGIVMSNSHHEPMLCADKEWNRRGKGKWDYAVNQKNLYQFWQACAKRNKPYESIYTLGMRGQEDTPMSEKQNIGLLEKIVSDQRDILRHTFTDRPLTDVPQVWTLYKEVQGYYEKGMRVPDDVTLLWADDNWGNIRRLPTPEERKRAGGAGVYYHFDYVGGPRSYRWINTVPIAKIWEQMHLAYEFEARQIWITNVGDLKPMEYPIDFFLTYAWDPDAVAKEQLVEYGEKWAAQQFGDKYAKKIAQILTAYTRHNGRRKPELTDQDTYSQLHYQEADRISAELQSYVSQAESIYHQIDNDKKSAFFQLVLHPMKATRTIFELYNNVAKNRLYAEQGRASTNHYADLARQQFAADAALKKQYHELENGRWEHFMDQTHIGYTHWNNPPADVMPWLSVNSPANVADMGVAVEGTAQSWPQLGQLKLAEFSPYGQQQRYIDVFNKGLKPFEFTATPSEKWLKVSDSKGMISGDKRIFVSIDWAKAPKGRASANVFIKGTGWGGAKVQISTFKPKVTTAMQGFIEADGYIAIEAAKGQAKQSQALGRWQEIPLHGRTHSSMTTVTDNIDYSFQDISAAPYLEYDLYLFSKGPIEIQTLVAPSLNFVPGRGLRFAIGIDDEQPQIIDILKNNKKSDWQESVKNGVRYAVSKHQMTSDGAHKLRIYMVDVGVVIQKIVINTGGLKESYLGPTQSMFIEHE